jgi:hypothetical protein
MMQCGHAANAIVRDHIRLNEHGIPLEQRELEPDKPACAICVCVDVINTNQNLEGRWAKCSICKHMSPSNPSKLAFFQFRGENSRSALNTCKVCSYNRQGCPIIQKRLDYKGEQHEFTSHGAFEYDCFYCGCRGWD